MHCTQLAISSLWVIPLKYTVKKCILSKVNWCGSSCLFNAFENNSCVALALSSKQNCLNSWQSLLWLKLLSWGKMKVSISKLTRNGNILSDSSEEHKWFLEINQQDPDQINPSNKDVPTADTTHPFVSEGESCAGVAVIVQISKWLQTSTAATSFWMSESITPPFCLVRSTFVVQQHKKSKAPRRTNHQNQ